MLSLFDQFESNVRYYCRDFPVLFKRAEQSFMFDVERNRYIDFFSGAGSLNYGHNHPRIKSAIVDYINENGIMQSLDLYTEAKYLFIDALQSTILAPRGLAYKQQFTGPTGTNAVEAALKLARKVTGRSSVVAFSNAFHGMSLGALAATASPAKRAGAGVTLHDVTRLPYQGFLGGADGEDDGRYVEAMLTNPGNGLDAPAAIILETVQGEGGLNTASASWLKRIAAVAAKIGALIIVDDIQTGCGRTGTFFSFEGLPIVPDIVCLSKSLSGSGLPLSVVLIAPKHDIWAPGEHNGTFRGNNLAFVSARAALDLWRDPAFLATLRRNVDHLHARLHDLVETFGEGLVLKGRGLIRGIELSDPALAQQIKAEAFRHRLIVETCGPTDSVVKLMPALNIDTDVLHEGLDILAAAFEHVLGARPHQPIAATGRSSRPLFATPTQPL